MGWCASSQLSSFGGCRERFEYGVLPRCALCPLFDAERAIRAGIREDPAPAQHFEIALSSDDYEISSVSDLLTLLGEDLPSWIDADFLVPDFPPEEWGEPADDGRPAA